jgi:hypothetical protein
MRRYRHYHYAGALLAALVVALSCGRSSDETSSKGTPPAASSVPRTLEHDVVGLGDNDDARERVVVGEQTFQPQEEPPATTLPPKRAKLVVTEKAIKETERVEVPVPVQPPPRETVPTPETAPQYNPRAAVPSKPPPQQRFAPLAPLPDDDRSRVTAKDVAIGVGTASMITGAVAAAGDGNDGARIFGVSMLGLGLASYATAGILALQEKPAEKKSTTTISVGPGLSVRGTF